MSPLSRKMVREDGSPVNGVISDIRSRCGRRLSGGESFPGTRISPILMSKLDNCSIYSIIESSLHKQLLFAIVTLRLSSLYSALFWKGNSPRRNDNELPL